MLDHGQVEARGSSGSDIEHISARLADCIKCCYAEVPAILSGPQRRGFKSWSEKARPLLMMALSQHLKGNQPAPDCPVG